MKLILFDRPETRTSLLPLTFPRAIADLRVGILTIKEKWERYTGHVVEIITDEYLQGLYPQTDHEEAIFIDASILPDDAILKIIMELEAGASISYQDKLIAARLDGSMRYPVDLDNTAAKPYTGNLSKIDRPWHLFSFNGDEIRKDYVLITKGRESGKIEDTHTITYNEQEIFLEDGAQVKAAILNAEDGPIYLGKDVIVSEGAIVKGPFAAGEGTIINMGAKIRQNTSTGPHCRLGGEIKESVFLGYCNKGHEGFVGNSVIGEWCNLGADTNTSNLKNTYQSVKIWDFAEQRFVDSGHQYLGLIMGDHAKAGINSMFNTGTVVGIGSNLFGAGYHRNFIPSFAWGGATKSYMTFKLEKFFEVAEAVMSRRGISMSEKDKEVYRHIYKATADYRFWER